MAALTVFLSMYSTTLSREREIAIMRSLGANRLTIVRIILFETLLLTLMGVALGHLFGYGLAAGIGRIMTDRSAVPVPIQFLAAYEPFLWAVSIGVGLIAGLLPALLAYRTDVVEKLSAS